MGINSGENKIKAKKPISFEIDKQYMNQLVDKTLKAYKDRKLPFSKQHIEYVVQNPNRISKILDAAYEMYLSSSEYLKYVDREVKRMFEESSICINTTSEILLDILDSKKIMNSHEIRDIGIKDRGNAVQGNRWGMERTLFDFNDDHPSEKLPVYGYLFPKEKIYIAGCGPVGREVEDFYGDIRIVLKDSIRNRTTASFGDYEYTNYGGYDDENYDDTTASVVAVPLESPCHLAYDFTTGEITADYDLKMKGLTVDNKKIKGNINTQLEKMDSSTLHTGIQYIECHIHNGGPRVEEIEKVMLPKDYLEEKKEKELIDELKKNNISYEFYS